MRLPDGESAPGDWHATLLLLDTVYAAVTLAVTDLTEEDARRSTRTDWTVGELLFHQLLDAQRALVTFASPADQGTEPDVDDVTYWAEFVPGADPAGASEHAEHVRAAAAAYPSTRMLVGHWTSTAEAACRAARAADPDGRVTTQGHVLAVEAFVGTLVLEAAVHLLDLTLELPGEIPATALRYVRGVLEQILGAPLPPAWDDTTAALKGTGRLPLAAADRAALGEAADRLPLLG